MSKQRRDQARTERAAAVRAAQARKERSRRLAVIVGIVVLLGAIVAGGAWYASGGDDDPAISGKTPPVAAGAASLQMGDADAPVKVVIFEDFLCPFCRELENSTRAFLQENADAGKVYVEYQPVNLLTGFAYSAKAMNAWAAVLKHSSPEAALRLHDILFDNQPYEQSSDQVSDDQIADWIEEAGADTTAVREALASQDAAFFATAQQAMTENDITGTPTVFVNGEQLPATSVNDMVRTIEAAVEQAS
jgi:protein-disulfide isomerase